jgi:putative polyhydroxyalkanoate system protein
MAVIAIAKKHALSHKRAKEAAQKVAEDLNARFALDYTWNGDCIDFRRPGLTGQLHILKDEVRLDCKLGFLLGAIKPAIEREVHKEFDHRFGKHAEHKDHKAHKVHHDHKGLKDHRGRKA